MRSQTFDPNSQVVRSTQTVQEQDRSQDSNGEPPVTAEQNLPQRDVRAQQQGPQSSNDSKRQEETVNYEISKPSPTAFPRLGKSQRWFSSQSPANFLSPLMAS